MLLGISSTSPSGLQLEEISPCLVKVCRMHTETSRCGTALDNAILSWDEAGADLVAKLCMQSKAKAPPSPSPSPVGGCPPPPTRPQELPAQRSDPSCNELTSSHNRNLRSETIQERSYTMLPWQLIESILQKDKNAELYTPLNDVKYFTQGWF